MTSLSINRPRFLQQQQLLSFSPAGIFSFSTLLRFSSWRPNQPFSLWLEGLLLYQKSPSLISYHNTLVQSLLMETPCCVLLSLEISNQSLETRLHTKANQLSSSRKRTFSSSLNPFRFALVGKFSKGRPSMETLMKYFQPVGFWGVFSRGLL